MQQSDALFQSFLTMVFCRTKISPWSPLRTHQKYTLVTQHLGIRFKNLKAFLFWNVPWIHEWMRSPVLCKWRESLGNKSGRQKQNEKSSFATIFKCVKISTPLLFPRCNSDLNFSIALSEIESQNFWFKLFSDSLVFFWS